MDVFFFSQTAVCENGRIILASARRRCREGCFDQTWQHRRHRRRGAHANTCCKRFDETATGSIVALPPFLTASPESSSSSLSLRAYAHTHYYCYGINKLSVIVVVIVVVNTPSYPVSPCCSSAFTI